MKANSTAWLTITLTFAGVVTGMGQPRLPVPTPLLKTAPTNRAPPPLTPAPRTARTSGTGPKIQFAELKFDFGQVKSGEVVKHSFVFTNTGDQTLEVTDVRPSGTGPGPSNPTWSRKVEPGQTGTIPVQFGTGTGSFSGSVYKTVTVACNDTNHPAIVLEFQGTVWSPIGVTPQYVYFTLTPDAQTNEVRVVRILNNQDNDVTLSPPDVNNRSFQTELKTIRPGKEFELRVTVLTPLKLGNISANVTIKTSLTNMPVIAVGLVAMVQPLLMAIPAQLTLPTGPLLSSTRMGVTFRNNGPSNVTISEPTINAPGVDARLQEIQAGRVFNVVLSFSAGFDVPAGQQVELTVKTSHPQYPTIKVPIVMMPRAAQSRK